MALVEWDPAKHSVNIQEIDRQHQKLFGCLNDLYDAMIQGKGREVIGNVLVSLERSSVSNHVGTLSIVIDEAWRDVGIGSGMVRAAQEWCRERGLEKLSLAVFPDNERAIAVYERAGFVREGLRRRQYRVEGEFRDELLMAWFPAAAGTRAEEDEA